MPNAGGNVGRILGTAIVLALIAACDTGMSTFNNSSSGDNDYFEEPLSERSEKYANALETSNAFVEALAAGEPEAAYKLLDSRLQASLPSEQFNALSDQIVGTFGPFKEYKKMQWGFGKNSKLENIVISIKIVVHEDTETFYILNFEDNGRYRRIIAFNIVPKDDGDRVSTAAGWAKGLE